MGIYIDPKDGSTKEDWLAKFATEVNSVVWEELPKGTLPVVLVENAAFTAAGIAYDKRELLVFQSPDPRPTRWFIAEVADLQKVQPFTEEAMKRGRF